MPPTTTNKKEVRVNIKKIKVKSRISNILTIKTTNIKKDIKTDYQPKIIHNSFHIIKTYSKWISLSYNQFFFKYSHITDQICYK